MVRLSRSGQGPLRQQFTVERLEKNLGLCRRDSEYPEGLIFRAENQSMD